MAYIAIVKVFYYNIFRISTVSGGKALPETETSSRPNSQRRARRFARFRPVIRETQLDATTRYELHTRLAAMPVHRKVCHGDFRPSNIIITPEDEAYVIDWAHVTQGNASADAARTYLLFYLYGEEKSAEQYLNLFCKKSDTARQYVQKWIPIVAASQSGKGKPEEKEFLLRWANVVEYE